MNKIEVYFTDRPSAVYSMKVFDFMTKEAIVKMIVDYETGEILYDADEEKPSN